MSEVLDDERKEAFLLALHSLKEEKEDAEAREEKLRQQQQEQMEERRKETEERRLEQSRAEDERRKREEENRRQPRGSDERLRKPPQPPPSQSSRTSRQPAKRPTTPPPGFYNRASTMFAAVQALIANTAHQMTANPMAMFRTFFFLLAFILAIGRRDLRERIMRLLRNAWDKVRRTVGMGVKVSYI
jgi:ribosomal protein L32E